MYTLMSQTKQAIDDLSIVIDMEESDENRKVCIMVDVLLDWCHQVLILLHGLVTNLFNSK